LSSQIAVREQTSTRSRLSRSGVLRALAYLVGAAAISYGCWAYYAYYWGSYASFNRSLEFCELRYCDFTLYYYEQAKVILESRAPIFKYFYSPTFALLLVPVAALPIDRALHVWSYVQGFSLLLFVVAGVALLRRASWWIHALFLFLTLTSHPILHNWKWGQANTLFSALTLASLSLSRRAPPALSALPLALATSARYYPALYAFAFVERRHWRTLGWFVALSLVLLLALPALLMGPAASWDFYRASAEASRAAATSWVLQTSGSQYLPTVLARLGAGSWLDTALGRGCALAFGYGLVLLNLLTARRAMRRSAEHAPAWSFCFLAGCTPLLLPTSWLHYFVYLPLAQVFLLARLLDSPLTLARRATAVLLVWAPCVALSSIFFFNTFEAYEAYGSGGYLLFSNLLMLALAHGLALSPSRQPEQGRQLSMPSMSARF
jgi:hypothetical protein